MLKYLALFCCFPGVALAQQPPPAEQALTNKLLQEISSSLQCQSALITTQRELEELKKNHGGPDAPPPSPPNK